MEPNEKKIAIMVVEEKENKKPERKIVTIEYEESWNREDETHVLSLTPDQYRLMQWLTDNDFFNESLDWHDGKPEVEIEEI